MYKVEVVQNGVEAVNLVEAFKSEGYGQEEIFIFAHNRDRSEDMSEATDTGEIGMREQGIFESFGNLFKSRGDELRSKMRSLGLTQVEADKYEAELDKGHLVLVATKEAHEMNNTKTY
ncbi:general stress protein [Falsibacillus albus]|uniref:General stress protein n=1 Tax=Falsibacillus albus TaxID=2478915 RepID=A0A3L7JTP8_9BACI|nr:general stress protein [Falsibacillus albus]RLQ93449.1 general stress protein [Falsibacillus albus]